MDTMQALTSVRARIAQIRSVLDDRGAQVDVPRLATEISELLQWARGHSDARLELRQLLILAGMTELKRGEPLKARGLLIDGLAMDAGASADPNQLTRDHYFLAGVAADLKNFQTAAEHYSLAASFALAATDFNVDQRLGIREKQAFVLHEARRFAEAYEVNQALLAEGERRFGANDPRLSTVMINTAQNLYALKRLPEAESQLQRALAIAAGHGEAEREQDLLYQLAVLAGELGKVAAARAYLTARVERLQATGPTSLQEAARRSLEDFDRHESRR